MPKKRTYNVSTGEFGEVSDEQRVQDPGRSPVDLRPDTTKAYNAETGELGFMENGEFNPISKERYFLEEEYLPQIDKEVKAYEEQIRDYQEDLTGHRYITDQEKQDRLTEIDMLVTKLQQEQGRISSRKGQADELKFIDPTTKGVMMQVEGLQKKREIERVSEKIKNLYSERSGLVKELTPVSDDEIKDIENNYGVANTFNDLEMIKKYGPDRTNRISREYQNRQMDVLSKTKIKQATPESIISYDNILFGEEPELKNVNSAEIDKIWKQTIDDPEYEKSDVNGKRKILAKYAKEYAGRTKTVAGEDGASKEEKVYEDPEAVEREILENSIKKFALAEDGDFTIEGLKLWNEHMSERNDRMLEYINQSLGVLGDPKADAREQQAYIDNLESLFGKERVTQWYKGLMAEAFQLKVNQDMHKKIADMPEARRGLKDLGKGFTSVPVHELMLGVYQVGEGLRINDIVNKVNEGKELSYGEDLALKTFATLNYAQNYDVEGTWYKAARGAVNMVPYIAQFLLSGPAYTAARGALLKSITPITRKAIGKAAKFTIGKKTYHVADLAALNLARMGATVPRSFVIPTMLAENTLTNIRDDVVLNPQMDGITAQVLENTGDSYFKGFAKGFGSTYVELLTEKMGPHLMKLVPGGARLGRYTAAKLSGREFVEKTTLAGWMEAKGIKSITDASKRIVNQKLGWNGIVEEYLEEVANYYLESRFVSGDRQDWDTFKENQLTTFLTVAMFGGMMKAGQTSYGVAVGNKMKYTLEDGKTVSIPQDVHNDLMVLLNNGEKFIDAKTVNALLDKHSDRLDGDQMALLLRIAAQNGSQRVQTALAQQGGAAGNATIDDETTAGFKAQLPKKTNEALTWWEGLNKNEKRKKENLSDPRYLLLQKEADQGTLAWGSYDFRGKDVLEPVLNTSDQLRPVTVDPNLSEAERKDIQAENTRIKAKYPDLVGLDLIQRDKDTGQLIEPTRTHLKQTLNRVSRQVSDKVEFDQHGNPINTNPSTDKLLAQKNELEAKLDETHDISIPYEDLAVDEKQRRIALELDQGKKLSGTTSIVTDRKFSVKLRDGRNVTVWFHEDLAPDVMKKAKATVLNKQKVELKLQHQREWNPDLSIVDEAGVPYGDRIQAWVGNQPIGAVQVFDFAEENRTKRLLEERKADAQRKFNDHAGTFVEGLGGIVKLLGKEEKADLAKRFKEFLDIIADAGILAGIEVALAVQKLVEMINAADNLSPEQKGFLTAMTHDNKELVERAATKAQAKERGIKLKTKEIKLEDIIIPSVEGVTASGVQKVDLFLNGYAPIWRAIAENIGTTKDVVEKTFYKIARRSDLLGNLRNGAVLEHFLNTLYIDDAVTNEILDVLRRSSIGAVTSLFNFYSNTRLTKQYGMVINNGVISWKLLNPSEQYDEFLNNFWSSVSNYQYKDNKPGYDSVQKRVLRHNELRDERFEVENRSFAKYHNMDPAERERLRREQHEKDLILLSEITGIAISTWREYFTEQTNETQAASTKFGSLSEFTTYDNLLSKDTWRRGFPRIQSNISFQLSLTPVKRDEHNPKIYLSRSDQEFKEAVNTFFTLGNEDAGTLSNLYKLSTAISERDDIGLAGIDIKSDRFSSFIQYSHEFKTAEQIRSLDLDNHIVKYYVNQDKEMEIVFLNGLHNLDINRHKKGTHNLDVSSEDLWVTQLLMFLQNDNHYRQWLGQHGDKPVIAAAEVPKIKDVTVDQIAQLKKKFPEFDEAVKELHDSYIVPNNKFFSSFLPSLTEEDTQALARDFVYNFARNMDALLEIFHGNYHESYDDLTDLIKRGGSLNSPGYLLNPHIEGGVGTTYRHAMVIDPTIIGTKAFDGMEFMLGEYAGRTQVSMGTILSKSDEEEILTTIKALYSNVDPVTNLRGLTKVNRVNIDILADSLPPNNKFAQVRDFMRANKIDVLSFQSGTKKHEKNAKKDKDGNFLLGIKLWDDTGKLLKKALVPEGSIFDRSTSDLYIQQELRHSTAPKSTKMPSQLLANMLGLTHGNQIARLIYELQQKVMLDMLKEFDKGQINETKIKWLKEKVNQNTQPDLYRLLEAGITPYEPSMANFMRKMLAGEMTRKALEVPINRVTTIEVLDPGIDEHVGLLRPREEYEHNGEKHILLPQIAVNIDGARDHNEEFKGDPKAAIEFVERNKESHLDLYDLEGNLMEWEIYGNDGAIPGEMIISTRVPADGLHSHTVARIRYKFMAGNFTMLDKESQKASGSDADGDQRFNQVFYKNKSGNIVNDDSKEGIANKIMMNIGVDYTLPRHDKQIRSAINTNAYDKTVNRLRIKQDKFSFLDWRGWNRGRNENIVGVKMKGIMTDAVTVYGLIANLGIEFKETAYLPIEDTDREQLTESKVGDAVTVVFDETEDVPSEIIEIEQRSVDAWFVKVKNKKTGKEYSFILDERGESRKGDDKTYIEEFRMDPDRGMELYGVVRDPQGLLRSHMQNLVNLAFDNASDPKIEILGLNEHTSNMFIISLIGNTGLNTKSNKAILKYIDRITDYFTSDLVKRFTDLMRRDSGGLRSEDIDKIKVQLAQEFKKDDVTALFDLYDKSAEFPDLRRFYRLTQKTPGSVVEYGTDEALYQRMKNNSFDFLDVRPLFEQDGLPITEFRISRMNLDAAKDYIFTDTFDLSPVGVEILAVAEAMMGEKGLTQTQKKSLNYGLNNIALIRALGVKQSIKSLHPELTRTLEDMRTKYPDNRFLQTIWVVPRSTTRVVDGQKIKVTNKFLEINPDYRHGKISDTNVMDIRNHFQELYNREPAYVDKLVSYVLQRWGATTSTWDGSFYNLFSDQYRVRLSQIVQNEIRDWQLDEINSLDKYNILQWMLRSSKLKGLRKLSALNPAYSSFYDYNSLATITYPISLEALNGIYGVASMEEYREYGEQHKFDPDTFTAFVKKNTGGVEVRPYAVKLADEFRKQAMELFPAEHDKGPPVKDLLPSDTIGEALASEDPGLQTFIFEWLRKQYPGVQIFADREAFYRFVRKHGGRGLNINPLAIGHAFKNAAFADPAKAVQSALFHEHAHIYWDALAENHPVKVALTKLYQELYAGQYNKPEDLEEEIIKHIGWAGVDMAKIEMEGNALTRFLNLLKKFWAAVKRLLGTASQKDLIYEMTYAIWNNRAKINPQTAEGKGLIKNMITNQFSTEDMPYLQNEPHVYFFNGEPIPAVSNVIESNLNEKFDAQAKANAATKSYDLMQKRLTKQKLTKEELLAEERALIDTWKDSAEKGTLKHKIAESVFFGKYVVTKEDIAQFEDPAIYRNFVKQLERIKNNIMERFPDLMPEDFITEEIIISNKYGVAGTPDLVVDIGDNKLLVYDFKTTDKGYADVDGDPLPSYTRAFGIFKPPFQNMINSKFNKHMLQTNMYANMLEEQEDPDKPGKKNQVVEIHVVPILREVNKETGKITVAQVDNLVKVPRNAKTKRIVDRMLEHDALLRKDLRDMYPQFRENLEKIGVPEVIIRDTIIAYQFFRQMVPDLHDMDRIFIGEVRNAGMGVLRTRLFDRGYTNEDLRGPKALTFEQLFYLAHLPDNVKLTRDNPNFHERLREMFPEQVAYSRYKAKSNPDAKKDEWHRIKAWDRDFILQDVGSLDVKVGDEIMMIYDLKRPSGRKVRDFYLYTVLAVKGRKVQVKNHDTGNTDWIYSPGGHDGMLRVHNTLPEGVEDPGKNSFVGRYIYDKEQVLETHYKTDFTIGEYEETVEGEQERMLKERQLRMIWRFFNDLKSFDAAEEFLKSEYKVINQFEELAVIEEDFGKNLRDFIQGEGINHFMAGAIKREHAEPGVPTTLLPMTVNLYYLLTRDHNQVWGNFDSLAAIRSNMPPRMIEGRFIPLTVFLSQTSVEFKKYAEGAFDLTRSFKRFSGGKVNTEIATFDDGGTIVWLLPSEISQYDHPVEHAFVTELYRYYRFFDPVWAEKEEAGQEEHIEVSQIFASRDEMIAMYGKKYGSTMALKLEPKPYDRVKLALYDGKDENGDKIYELDKNGEKVIRTLGQIKEDFVFTEMTDEQKADFFGPKWKHLMRIPGTIRTFGKAGRLNDYIRDAEAIWDGREDKEKLNPPKTLAQSQKKMKLVGRGRTKYPTKYIVEGEEKAIDSMIYRHYMKRMMPALDWMIDMYGSHSADGKDNPNRIMKYIRDWGNYQLYKQKPEAGILDGKTMTDLVHAGNRLNSLNKIMFSMKTQFFNLAIGQTMDLIREPVAYARGVKRLFGSGNRINNLKKAWNILRRYNMANIISDVTFDQIDKEFRVLGQDISKYEKVGYSFMEGAEKANQIPIFIGLMSDEEWNAYNVNGTIKVDKQKDAMSHYRALMIESRVQDIHGDYGTIHAAPFWLTNIGQAGLQFRKWLPAMIWAEFSPYHINRNLAVRSGILPTVKLAFKWFAYNSRTTQAQQEKRAAKIEQMIENGEMNDLAFFKTTDQYLKTLMVAVNGGKITWKDLSGNDKRNMVSAMLQLMMGLGMAFTTAALLQGDDDKTVMTYAKRMFLPLFNRFAGDVFWVFTPANWEYLNEGLFPATSILVNGFQFMADFLRWIYSFIDPTMRDEAYYNKDTLLAVEGTPKFLISSTYILPAGSFVRWLQQKKRTAVMKRNRIDLSEFDLTPEELRMMGLNEAQISEFDIYEKSYKYKRIIRDMKQAAKYNALRYNNIDPGLIMDMETGEKLIRAEADELKEALIMHSLEQMHRDGQIDLEQVQEDAAAYRRYEDSRKATRKKKKERKFEEAKETFK